jgi:hypothetical protein
MRHGKYDLPLDNSDSTFSTGQSAMSASRPETFDKLFMASVRASGALREPANILLHRTGFWPSSSGK